jgi:hypothetical protein
VYFFNHNTLGVWLFFLYLGNSTNSGQYSGGHIKFNEF